MDISNATIGARRAKTHHCTQHSIDIDTGTESVQLDKGGKAGSVSTGGGMQRVSSIHRASLVSYLRSEPL